MNDRELLKMAAKAAGYASWDFLAGEDGNLMNVYADDGHHDVWWPLEDDGDALRLAVKLCLFNGAEFYHFRSLERFGGQDSDDLTATRRAIVRAAAEIGRKME